MTPRVLGAPGMLCCLGEVGGAPVTTRRASPSAIEADQPVELTVFIEVDERTFDVLNTGKRGDSAVVLTIEVGKSTTMLAAMVRTGQAIPRPPAGRGERSVRECSRRLYHTHGTNVVRSPGEGDTGGSAV